MIYASDESYPGEAFDRLSAEDKAEILHEPLTLTCFKGCSCGLEYSEAEYLALPAPKNGERQETDFGTLLLRNCSCGSTMAVEES